MNEFSGHITNVTPPPRLLPVLQKIKSVYILWHGYYQVLPKTHRYSIGLRIDTLFVELIEATSIAGFLSREEKQPLVRIAIRKNDTIKIFLMVLWETGSLETKRYVTLSLPLEEIGRMLGGWNGQLQKQNSPVIARGEK
ncbi:MAG: four helix bundle protein [bacterium]|nr:four helix bundle protein [bacterium]